MNLVMHVPPSGFRKAEIYAFTHIRFAPQDPGASPSVTDVLQLKKSEQIHDFGRKRPIPARVIFALGGASGTLWLARITHENAADLGGRRRIAAM